MAEQYLVSKKYHEISMLAGEITNRVCKNGDEWTKYLTTAARLYQYPFEDQLPYTPFDRRIERVV